VPQLWQFHQLLLAQERSRLPGFYNVSLLACHGLNAYLRWALSEASALFLRGNPDAQNWLEKKTKKHNKAKALTLLSHKLGRAVYFMLKRKTFFDQEKFLATS